MHNTIIQKILAEKIQTNLYRRRDVLIQTRSRLNFSSNDYLSLASNPAIKKAYQEGVKQHPVGSGGSMVVCGYHPIHQTLERTFAEALGVEDALVCSSGFLANLSVVHLLVHLKRFMMIDKEVHASIYHGLRQHKALYGRYRHNDVNALAHQLARAPEFGVIITESLFSMSGQIAPLEDLLRVGLAKNHRLVVDEAHAFGVMGPEGLGLVKQEGLGIDDVPLRIIPLGKSFASQGAIIAGSGIWIDALLQVAYPYIYSTGISPAWAYGVLETLDWIRKADARREKLSALVAYFRSQIAHSPLTWRDCKGPIQQLQLGCPKRSLQLAQDLKMRAMDCVAIRQPTVRKAETGLRIILNHHHECEDIDGLLTCIHEFT